MEVVLTPLPIDARYKRALLGREGVLGAVLDSVLAYESGNWSVIANVEVMQRSFWEAAQYSHTMIRQMLSVAAHGVAN
jgi:c-di-GMP-related signal transduction protein